MVEKSQNDRKKFIIILTLFAVYAIIYIFKTSFIIDGVRYYSLFDDAMISMRYASNIAHGNGFVFNIGERVEGFTNPLWTLYMAAVHFLPVSQPKICFFIQITGALLLLLNLVFVRKIALLISEGSALVSFASVLLTAFYMPLIFWSLLGMEVSLQTLLMSIIICRVIIALRDRRFPWEVYILLGIGTLIRIDMALPFIGLWLFLIFTLPEHRKKSILWGGSLFIFFFGGQTILRYAYYGEVLPNTYYLKMTGFPILLRISRGVVVWWKFIWNLNLILFLVPVLAVIFTYKHSLGAPATVIVLQMLYSIYVGGDAWEEWGGSNRYIAFVMPQFFILFAYGINLIKKSFLKNETLLAGIKKNALKYKTYDFIRRRHFIALLLFAFFQFNNSVSFNMRGFLFIDLPPHVENIKNMVERALLIKRITTPDARIAVTWAGAIPYFSERYTVDILGKTDKVIARSKMRRDPGLQKFTQFVPGHMKFDYKYSFGELKPDVVLQFWGDLEEPEPYILGIYTKLVVGDKFYYLRNGSEKVKWDVFSKEKK